MKNKHNLDIRSLTIDNGLSYPSNEELIMLILGSGTKNTPVDTIAEKAIEVIEKSNPVDLVQNLIHINGIGCTKALSIAAALELGQRLNRKPDVTLTGPQDIIPYVQHYALQKKEHFLSVTLTGARELMSIRVICTGSGNMAIMKPRDIFAEAIKECASAIILCHNHPSGISSPSQQDIETTRRIDQAAKILGITLLDHIIITNTNYYSFRENDIL